MIEYVKIETPFIRAEDGSKKLIEGKYRNETVEYLRNSLWEFTEKIDGTSTTFTMRRHKGVFGTQYEFLVCSRNVVFDKPDKKLSNGHIKLHISNFKYSYYSKINTKLYNVKYFQRKMSQAPRLLQINPIFKRHKFTKTR